MSFVSILLDFGGQKKLIVDGLIRINVLLGVYIEMLKLGYKILNR